MERPAPTDGSTAPDARGGPPNPPLSSRPADAPRFLSVVLFSNYGVTRILSLSPRPPSLLHYKDGLRITAAGITKAISGYRNREQWFKYDLQRNEQQGPYPWHRYDFWYTTTGTTITTGTLKCPMEQTYQQAQP